MTALIFGGAACGKSAYGERLACALPRQGKLVYLATMEPVGEEAQARIRRHREQRAGKGFVTLERPRNLEDGPSLRGGTVLLEDLGNLAANELFFPQTPDPEEAYRSILRGLRSLQAGAEHLIVISNDLHRDEESYPRETEEYLELLARLHRDLAARADQVVEVVCGLPIVWKGEGI